MHLSGLFVAYDRFFIVHRQSPLGPVDPSFRALSGRLQFMVRRHEFNKDSLSLLRYRLVGLLYRTIPYRELSAGG